MFVGCTNSSENTNTSPQSVLDIIDVFFSRKLSLELSVMKEVYKMTVLSFLWPYGPLSQYTVHYVLSKFALLISFQKKNLNIFSQKKFRLVL